MDELIKEAVIKILEILSTAEPVRDAMTVDGDNIPCQYIIDSNEVSECRELLTRIDPDNQQLRVNKS